MVSSDSGVGGWILLGGGGKSLASVLYICRCHPDGVVTSSHFLKPWIRAWGLIRWLVDSFGMVFNLRLQRRSLGYWSIGNIAMSTVPART